MWFSHLSILNLYQSWQPCWCWWCMLRSWVEVDNEQFKTNLDYILVYYFHCILYISKIVSFIIYFIVYFNILINCIVYLVFYLLFPFMLYFFFYFAQGIGTKTISPWGLIKYSDSDSDSWQTVTFFSWKLSFLIDKHHTCDSWDQTIINFSWFPCI